jgi:hypothetical protein
MKTKSIILRSLPILTLLLISYSCLKEEEKTPPEVTISAVTNITNISTLCEGEITADGGSPVTERGFCWSTINPTPVLTDSKINNGSGSGNFNNNITGLLPGVFYYLRAYATNSIGTSYSSQVTFKTATTDFAVTTSVVGAITSISAECGGTISSDGGSPVTTRGVCWSTTANPTIANSKTIDGTGKGTYVSAITGLTGGTTYYLKAYVSNSSGTVYGNQMVITTASWLASQSVWLNKLATNTISTPENLLDNNSATKGGLAMSYYLTVYTKEVFLDFGSSKTISGFGFSFEFPNVLTGKCSNYPGPGDIAHTCLGNLYYKDAKDKWIRAYPSAELSVSRADQGCPMTDSVSYTFPSISAKEWKFEIVGGYWLGGGYQSTTYYQISDIKFFGY